MPHLGKKSSRPRTKAQYKDEYQKLDKPQSRSLYHEILQLLKTSIVEGDIIDFRKYVELLESINKLQKTKQNQDFLIEGSLFENTNVLLLACQYERLEHLKVIISNYCNILYLKAPQQSISPFDEDEHGKNAYYYLIRTSNIQMLEQLIEAWPDRIEKNQLDLALSKSYSNLIIQNVDISDGMKFFIQYTLNKLRLSDDTLGNMDVPKATIEEIKKRSRLISSTIDSLINAYGGQSISQIDEKFVYSLKFLTLNMNVLKRMLRFTYDRLPWEEVQFLLIIFTTNLKSTTKTSFFYKSYIKRENLLKFLKEFGIQLFNVTDLLEEGDLTTDFVSMDRETVAQEISKQSPVFEELYETHSKIRDFYLVETIIDHLDTALESDELNDKTSTSFESDLIVQKCLLLVWESMKSSTTLCNILLVCFSEKLQTILMDMDNILEDQLGLSLESMIRKHFLSIVYSLQEILAISKDLFMHMQLQRMYEITDKCLKNLNLTEFENLKETLDFENIALEDHTEKQVNLKKFVSKIRTELSTIMDSKLEFLLDEVVQLLKHYEEVIEARATCFTIVAMFVIGSNASTDIGSNMQVRAEQVFQLHLISKIEYLVSRMEYHGSSYSTKMMDTLTQMLHHVSSKGSEKTGTITKLKYFLSPFLGVKTENQMLENLNHKDTVRLFKKSVRESSCLEQILKDKIGKLKKILDRFDLVDNHESIKHFIIIKGRTETYAKVEMLLFDILTILQNELSPNFIIYDLDIPLLMGLELRNYLMWGEARNMAKMLDSNVKLSVIVHCHMLIKQISVLPMNLIKHVPTISDVESKWNYDIHRIEKKMDFFKALECGSHNDSHGESVDLLSRNYDDLTAVHIAVKAGNLQFLKRCSSAGKKEQCLLKDRSNRLQQNILHIAARYCNLENINAILKDLADIKVLLSQLDKYWRIPLHYAGSHATAETVTKLLKHYPDGIFVRDKKGFRPIHMAIRSNNIPAFNILLDSEKDINNRLGPYKQSLLHIAAATKSEEITKLLIDRGADVNLSSENDSIPLHMACSKGSYSIVKILVHKGSDINARDDHKATPLCYAAEAGHLDVVRFLLANNADIHSKTNMSVLHHGVLSGSTEIIKEILRNGAVVNIRDFKGTTPLFVAVLQRNLDATKTLLEHGANVDLENDEGVTPLALAIILEDSKMIELIMSYNPQWDVGNPFPSLMPLKLRMLVSIFSSDNGFPLTAIHLALIFGEMSTLKRMREKGVILHKVEYWEMAVRSESIETVRLVFDACNPNYLRQNLEKLNDVLYIALRMRSGEIAKYLMDLGADIDYKTLDHAILNFNSKLVNFIVEKHVLQNKADECFRILEEYWTSIVYSEDIDEIAQLFIKYANIKKCQNILRNSVQSNNIGLITLLIEAGVRIDLESIFHAMTKGNTDVAKLLLENSQIEINSKDSSNETLLHIAAKHCDSNFVDYLISKGSEVNSTAGSGSLPIDYAAMSGKHRSVGILLRNGSKLGSSIRIAIEMDDARLLRIIIDNSDNIDQIDRIGSALHLALWKSSETCSYLLLDSGEIDVDCVNTDKSTPLHLAASGGNVLVTKILVAMNADIQKLDGKGNKPVHNAIRSGQLETLTFYVENHYKNVEGTLLHDVARTTHTELAQYLLRKNFDVNAKDGNGETALHIAARSSSWSMCRTLIENGAYYNIKNKDGMSPGDVASTKTKPYFMLLQSLFEIVRNKHNTSRFSDFIHSSHHKVCLNAKSEDGRSLLHFAVSQESVEVVQNLLSYNANLNITDSELNTPLHYAVKSNNLRIVKALLSAGAKYSVTNIHRKSPYNLSRSSNIKHLFLIIDRAFKFTAEKNPQVCKIIEDVSSSEDRKMIVFGARNDQGQSLYSYAVIHGLKDIEKIIGFILNKVETLEWEAASKLGCEGKIGEAVVRQSRIITRFESLYGKSNPMVLNVKKELVNALYVKEDYKECLELNEDLIERLAEVYDQSSDLVAKQHKFSAYILSLLGDHKKVRRILNKISIKQSKIDESKLSFTENWKLSETYSNIGWYKEALAINQLVMDACEKKLNKDELITLETFTKRADILTKQENLSEAYNLLNTICLRGTENWSHTYMHHMSALESLSLLLLKMDHLDESIRKLEHLYKLCERQRGSSGHLTVDIKRRVMLLHIQNDDFEAAKRVLDNIYPALRSIPQNFIQRIRLDAIHHLIMEQIVESILKKSAKEEQRSQIWRHGALYRAIKEGNTEKVSEFLKIDNTLIEGVDKNGVTPLHWAVNVNNTGILTLLMESGADPLASTKNNNSILHTAANQGNASAVKTIIDHVNQKFGKRLHEFLDRKTARAGKTALHVAAEKGSHEICLYLLQNGAIYNSLTKDNKKPIDLAKGDTVKSLFNMVETIFKYIETIDDNLLSLLQDVSDDELKAFKNCRNLENKTLLDCATKNKKRKILNFIIELLTNEKKN